MKSKTYSMSGYVTLESHAAAIARLEAERDVQATLRQLCDGKILLLESRLSLAEKVVEAMEAVEWSGHRSFCPDGSGADACPSCHGYKPASLDEYDMQFKNEFDREGFFGHAADCALKAALDAARGER